MDSRGSGGVNLTCMLSRLGLSLSGMRRPWGVARSDWGSESQDCTAPFPRSSKHLLLPAWAPSQEAGPHLPLPQADPPCLCPGCLVTSHFCPLSGWVL